MLFGSPPGKVALHLDGCVESASIFLPTRPVPLTIVEAWGFTRFGRQRVGVGRKLAQERVHVGAGKVLELAMEAR